MYMWLIVASFIGDYFEFLYCKAWYFDTLGAFFTFKLYFIPMFPQKNLGYNQSEN